MRIKITADDIESAVKHRDEDDTYMPSVNCPLAIAVQRALDDDTVSVGWDSVYNSAEVMIGKLSKAANTFSHAFDDSEFVKGSTPVPGPVTVTYTPI